jgi:UDP-N-acetylglucosamine 3-dehydrogenase
VDSSLVLGACIKRGGGIIVGDTLNVGVIGLGRAGEKHALVYDKMPFVNILAVCDANPERLELYCNKLQTKGYKDYHELLADKDLDAVSIVLPDNMHLDVTKAAIKSKKHILLEKPIASTLSDGSAIYELAKDYQKVFMVGHTLRFESRYNLAKQSIDEGRIGDIIHVSCRRNSTTVGAMMYKDYTDTHIHLMIHDIDYINWIVASKPVKVFAKCREVLLKQYNMKDTIIALIEYENGILACVEACWILPANSPTELDDKMEIIGTEGALYIDSCDKGINLVSASKIHFPDSRHWPEINGEIGGTFYEELTSFINCIIKNQKPIIGAYEALQALAVVDAIARSLTEGHEVPI